MDIIFEVILKRVTNIFKNSDNKSLKRQTMQHSYLYKAYLLQYLSMGVVEMIDYPILSEDEFKQLAIDRHFLPCYNLGKSTKDGKNSEAI